MNKKSKNFIHCHLISIKIIIIQKVHKIKRSNFLSVFKLLNIVVSLFVKCLLVSKTNCCFAMVLLVMLFNSIKVLGQQCQIMSPEENYCWTYPDADPDMFDNFVDAAGNVYSKYVPVSHYTDL